ncbi:MAG: hypothetical protein HYS36_08555 [Candidatus Rokubacteria bacterium]|nr:hypothetical protein [Candidatus Rokubacteria bacterium]
MKAAGNGGHSQGEPTGHRASLRPYYAPLATYNFGAEDMTGIALTSYVYSKLMKGLFTRLPFRVGK